MTSLRDLLVSQLARPHGLLARLAAPLLDRGNRVLNLHTLAALDLQPHERVLEVGFGGGAGLAMALAHEPSITLSGIEPSSEMVTRSAARFGDRARVSLGSVEAIRSPEGSFEKVFGVNVVYFWPDLDAALAELHRVLTPGGTLALGIRPKEALTRVGLDRAGHRVWDAAQYVAALERAGFVDVRARRVPDPNGACVITAHRAGARRERPEHEEA